MKKAIQVVLSVCLLAAAGYFVHQYLNAPVPGDEGKDALWLCTSAGCEREFRTPPAAMVANLKTNPDGAMPCPACGKSLTIRAAECTACMRAVRTIGHGQLPDACPHCKASMHGISVPTPG